MWKYEYADELCHYGVKGQKWGVRRYQDENGRLKRGHEKRYGEWPPVRTVNSYASAKKAYEHNKKMLRKSVEFRKKNPGPVDNPYFERWEKTHKALTEKTEKFLSTLEDRKVKDLLQFDEEHGKHYVDARLFNPSLEYEDFVEISNDFAKRYKK